LRAKWSACTEGGEVYLVIVFLTAIVHFALIVYVVVGGFIAVGGSKPSGCISLQRYGESKAWPCTCFVR
jgi:hypothetical protein